MKKFDAPEAAKLAALTEEHGPLHYVEDEDGSVFIIARPKNARAAMQMFTDKMASSKKFEAFESLTKAACVYPDKDVLKRILDDEPGLVFALGDKAGELLGVRQLSAKKG